MSKPLRFLVPSFLLALLSLFALRPLRLLAARADPAIVPFQDCFDEPGNTGNKLNVSTVYAQVLRDDEENHYLNLTVIGVSPSEIIGLTNASSSLGEWLLFSSFINY